MKNIQRSVPTYVEYIDSIRWEFCPRHHNRHTPSRSPGQPWVVNIHSFCFIAPAAAHGEDDHHVVVMITMMTFLYIRGSNFWIPITPQELTLQENSPRKFQAEFRHILLLQIVAPIPKLSWKQKNCRTKKQNAWRFHLVPQTKSPPGPSDDVY